MTRDYQRLHLRAPYQQEILYSDESFVFKASTLNISEGGILLDLAPHFPQSSRVPFLLSIPQYPSFKNFDLLKLKTFSLDLFPAKTIRVVGQVARKEGEEFGAEDVFKTHIGIQFTHVPEKEKKIITEYVENFASNLMTLTMWIDLANNDGEIKSKARTLARILGYTDSKLAELRFSIFRDYKSLQWS